MTEPRAGEDVSRFGRSMLLAVLRRPWLAPAAVGLAWRVGLRPSPDYLAFRESVLGRVPTVDDTANYLRWCSRFPRSWRGLRGVR